MWLLLGEPLNHSLEVDPLKLEREIKLWNWKQIKERTWLRESQFFFSIFSLFSGFSGQALSLFLFGQALSLLCFCQALSAFFFGQLIHHMRSWLLTKKKKKLTIVFFSCLESIDPSVYVFFPVYFFLWGTSPSPRFSNWRTNL